jgi:hypothetical protein
VDQVRLNLTDAAQASSLLLPRLSSPQCGPDRLSLQRDSAAAETLHARQAKRSPTRAAAGRRARQPSHRACRDRRLEGFGVSEM